MIIAWAVHLCSQHLHTRPSLRNSLPHCDQYDSSLHPPSSTSPLAGLTLVSSHITTCNRTVSWFWAACILSLNKSPIFTDWIRVASFSIFSQAPLSEGKLDRRSALPCNWPGQSSTSKLKSLSLSSHLASWSLALGFLKFCSHSRALWSVLTRNRCLWGVSQTTLFPTCGPAVPSGWYYSSFQPLIVSLLRMLLQTHVCKLVFY